MQAQSRPLAYAFLRSRGSEAAEGEEGRQYGNASKLGLSCGGCNELLAFGQVPEAGHFSLEPDAAGCFFVLSETGNRASEGSGLLCLSRNLVKTP